MHLVMANTQLHCAPNCYYFLKQLFFYYKMHYELRPASFRFFKGFFCIKIEILLSHEDLETLKK